MTIDKGEIRTSFRLAKDKHNQISVKPILFSTEMVRAILDGRKTVTRRVIKPQPGEELAYIWGGSNHGKWSFSPYNESCYEEHRAANDWMYWTPPCHTDDVLWVRETWAYGCTFATERKLFYRADGDSDDVYRWRPSIHMPREAARIWLRVTGVRVERLQEISYEDLRREGGKSDFYMFKRCRACGYGEPHYPECDYEHCDNYERLWEESFVPPFMKLWDSTIKHADLDCYGWYANPWVWVIAFERCEKPEEA